MSNAPETIQDRLREHVAGGRKFDSHAEAADQIDAQQETIAALVEALESMLALYGRPFGRAQRQARAALAKAGGEK